MIAEMAPAPRDRPAPGRLEIVREFVNTLNLDRGSDELADPVAAARWFERQGLPTLSGPLAPSQLEKIAEVRDAFRALLVANAAGSAAERPVRVLNELATRSGLAIQLTGPAAATPVITAGKKLDVALAEILAIAVEAMFENTWSRLKACPAPTCHWAFYDRSRNRSSRWCDMAVCGSRSKRESVRRRSPAANSSESQKRAGGREGGKNSAAQGEPGAPMPAQGR